MMKGLRFAGVLALMMVLLLCGAMAEEAQDITAECQVLPSMYGHIKEKMLDNGNMTMWETEPYGGHIEVITPAGKPAAGVYIKWGTDPLDTILQVPGEAEGEWVDVLSCNDGWQNQYIAFPEPLEHFRVKTQRRDVKMYVIKFQVLSEGTLPDWVQVWQPFEGKADLMVLVAHPDDELLFMGGVIPYYNTVAGKKVIVCYLVDMDGFRKVELLDGLWHCGVRHYPEMPGETFKNYVNNTRKEMVRKWGEERLLGHVSMLLRKYRPDVIVTHDVNGEYGHGAHKACCWAVQQCVTLAADESKYADSLAAYGPWQVKKAYIHLFKGTEGQIDFDWRQPMEAFGGKTIHQVTDEAFQLHRSQAASGKYVVEDFGRYDNSLFGLYFTMVGPDTGRNDLFENLP